MNYFSFWSKGSKRYFLQVFRVRISVVTSYRNDPDICLILHISLFTKIQSFVYGLGLWTIDSKVEYFTGFVVFTLAPIFVIAAVVYFIPDDCMSIQRNTIFFVHRTTMTFLFHNIKHLIVKSHIWIWCPYNTHYLVTKGKCSWQVCCWSTAI